MEARLSIYSRHLTQVAVSGPWSGRQHYRIEGRLIIDRAWLALGEYCNILASGRFVWYNVACAMEAK